MATKPDPLDTPPSYEEWGLLFNKFQIDPGGITHLTRAKLEEFSDREFVLLCVHDRVCIKISEATLLYVKERLMQLGISYSVDSKENSIISKNRFNGQEKHP